MIQAIAWPSSETSPRLTPFEVEQLFAFTQEMASLGQLTEGKYVGATKALYWQRIPKEN